MDEAGPVEPAPGRFIADAMLGRLARWLRILGYDTAYDKDISDQTLIARALAEHRWVLTRDGYLARRKLLRGLHTLIRSAHIEDQLRQLHRELGVELDVNHERGHRCADCNDRLLTISQPEAAPLVPPFVAQQYREFLQCPRSRRVFWAGTHWKDLCRRLAALREGRGLK